MQLVNLEISSGVQGEHCKLGAFSSGLNAVFGPSGSSKSGPWVWLKQVLARESTSPTYFSPGNHSADPGVAGAIEWRIGHGLVRSAVSENATQQPTPLSRLQHLAMTELLDIAGDSKSIAKLHGLARRLGMTESFDADRLGQRQYLLDRQQELENQLRRLDSLAKSQESLLSRKLQLENELGAVRTSPAIPNIDLASERQRLCNLISAAESDIQHTTRQIEDLDLAISNLKKQRAVPNTKPNISRVPQSYRDQMSELDGQLYRWRQTLREIRAYRDRLQHNATDLRLDQQIGDQISASKQAEPRLALRSLEGQILTMREHLTGLLGRYRSYQNPEGLEQELPLALQSLQRELYDVCQQLSRHEAQTISQTLSEQSAQLARCDAELLQAIEKLIGQRGELLRRMAEELQLSEADISLAFGDWCECHNHPHLHDWLQDENVATSKGQTCTDENPLRLEIDRLEEEQRLLDGRRTGSRQELYELESQLRRLGETRPSVIAQRAESDILQDLSSVSRDLLELDSKNQLATELEDIRRRLQSMPTTVTTNRRFTELYDLHLSALGGTRALGPVAIRNVNAPRPFASAYLQPMVGSLEDRNYMTSAEWAARRPSYNFMPNSPSTQTRKRVYGEPISMAPDAVVDIALRLAIAQCLSETSHPIPVILDSTLDSLAADWQESVIRHLSDFTRSGQQVIVATGDSRVETLVRNLGGTVFSLRRDSRLVEPPFDVNRTLSAYANEHEAEKWREPLPLRKPTTPIRPRTDRQSTRVRSATYLVEASLIDHLPSIPASIVSDLKSLGIHRIADLLDADPNWLANSLGEHQVGLAIVQVWQAEARLLCNVPKLRPFDARVLVGAGIRQPSQLAQMHPSRLLDRVEQFLATERGREILRSGNSYELSRITSWIASAKNGVTTHRRDNFPDSAEGTRSRSRQSDRGEVTSHDNSERKYANARTSAGSTADEKTKRRAKSAATQSRRKSKPSGAELASVEPALKYYLNLASPVVEAPSIGPRMAERMQAFGVSIVEQFLGMAPDVLASKIGSRQVTGEIVRAWQDQTRLVCRIPNLRGHDAQLLVAAGISSPEELARMQPAVVLQQVTGVANSADGQRMLRGSKAPDLAEVTDWIRWSTHSRSIQAA